MTKPKFDINKYVNEKIEKLKQTDKSFRSIYTLMFRDKDLTMFEYMKGAKIERLKYGECEAEIERVAYSLNNLLSNVEKGQFVGIYAQNSIEWVVSFWSLLKSGYKPILLNTRMDVERLKQAISHYNVGAVITDSVQFSCPCIQISQIGELRHGENPPQKIDSWADEIAVMSSGTTLASKLCVYTGENFYYQLLDSANIITTCKQMSRHYEGELKQLMFLPLYHIFGLAAMLMWFSFFQRSFVLLKDQNPETILYTIRKHKVTHIFSVPLFWNTVYKLFNAQLAHKGAKTVNKFNKGLALIKKLKSPRLARMLMGEVRENLFGESVQFLISGGSVISSEVLTFFNGIGYHMANGYGMSEIGITSVELSSSFASLTDCSVGKPFSHTEYKINEKGELLVRSRSMASEIYIDGKKEELTNGYYNTMDVSEEKNGRYFIYGRKDELIVGQDGENINPAWLEKQIKIKGAENHCIVERDGAPALIIQIKKFTPRVELESLKKIAREELSRLNISASVQSIYFTSEPLISGSDFKINRRKIKDLPLISESEELVVSQNEIAGKIRALFANALGSDPSQISDTAHFFFDLKGTSLDYFVLLSSLKEELGIELSSEKNNLYYTVAEIEKYLTDIL